MAKLKPTGKPRVRIAIVLEMHPQVGSERIQYNQRAFQDFKPHVYVPEHGPGFTPRDLAGFFRELKKKPSPILPFPLESHSKEQKEKLEELMQQATEKGQEADQALLEGRAEKALNHFADSSKYLRRHSRQREAAIVKNLKDYLPKFLKLPNAKREGELRILLRLGVGHAPIFRDMQKKIPYAHIEYYSTILPIRGDVSLLKKRNTQNTFARDYLVTLAKGYVQWKTGEEIDLSPRFAEGVTAEDFRHVSEKIADLRRFAPLGKELEFAGEEAARFLAERRGLPTDSEEKLLKAIREKYAARFGLWKHGKPVAEK